MRPSIASQAQGGDAEKIRSLVSLPDATGPDPTFEQIAANGRY